MNYCNYLNIVTCYAVFILKAMKVIARVLLCYEVSTSGAGTAYPSGAPEFTPGYSGIRVTRSLVLYECFVDRFCPFVLFLLAIVLSVLLRYTDSDCPFVIFKFICKYDFSTKFWNYSDSVKCFSFSVYSLAN